MEILLLIGVMVLGIVIGMIINYRFTNDGILHVTDNEKSVLVTIELNDFDDIFNKKRVHLNVKKHKSTSK